MLRGFRLTLNSKFFKGDFMKTKYFLATIVLSFLMVNSVFAQIKIGEVKDSTAIITHDMQDLLQACELELDREGKTALTKAEIKVFSNGTYWLFAGNSPNEGEYIITIKLVKSTENNDLFVEHFLNETNVKYGTMNKPRPGVKLERYLKKY
jgi:hypothetical protein